MAKEALRKLGCANITLAEDGAEGISKLQQAANEGHPYQFIICDWNMPHQTGIDVLEYRNKSISYADCPFLMVTIESERDYVLKAVTMGVSGFIVKPFSEHTLIAKVKKALERT